MSGIEVVRYPKTRKFHQDVLFVCPGCGNAEWHPPQSPGPYCILLARHDDDLLRVMIPATAKQKVEAEAILVESA